MISSKNVNSYYYYFSYIGDKREGVGDFPGGPVVKNPPASTEDMGSITGPERVPKMPWGS